MSDRVRFEERQRFRQWWLWGLLALSGAGVVGGTIGSDDGPVAVAVGLGILGGVAVLLWVASLTSQVRSDGIYVRFFPRHRSFRQIAWDDIESIETREYSPVQAFGGWGLRWQPGRVAYTVSGDHAVVLHRRDDHDLWLGTERPAAFVDAIEDARPYA